MESLSKPEVNVKGFSPNEEQGQSTTLVLPFACSFPPRASAVTSTGCMLFADVISGDCEVGAVTNAWK